jgi:hypothetical protein
MKGRAGKDSVKEQASPLRLRIQSFDLICRHDVDLWLSVAKSDYAGDADGFPLDHGKSLIGCYRDPAAMNPANVWSGYSPPKLINAVPSGLVVTETTCPHASTSLPI